MDEMNELYYREPYTNAFDAELISCTKKEDHYEVVLSDTAFYPEGGGQPADIGTLNGIEVYDVQNFDGIVVHYTKAPVEHKNVHGIIDWNRRFLYMQMHTADHIFSGLVHSHFGYDNVGFSISEHEVRMDFNGTLTDEDIVKLEEEANEAVWKNLPITASFPDHEQLLHMDYRAKKELTGKVRLITIPGIDVCACCGTHVAYTGEVGLIRIYSCEKYKNGVRVLMMAGRRALEEDRLLTDQNHAVSVLLSSESQNTAKAVENLLNQNNELHKKINDLNAKLLNYKLNDFPPGESLAIDFEENIDRTLMVHIANDLCDQRKIGTAAVLNRNGRGYDYVIISRTKDLKALVKELNSSLHGRGGGKPDSVQGNFQADKKTIEAVLTDILK